MRLKSFIKKLISSNDKYTLEFTGRVSLEANYQALFKDLSEVLRNKYKPKVEVNLEDVEFLYPSAIITLLTLKDVLEKINVSVNFKVKECSPVHEYLVLSKCHDYMAVPGLPEGL